MISLVTQLQTLFNQATSKAYPELQSFEAEIVPSTQEKFGHYQFNSSMKLSKLVKENPRQIAEKIVFHMEQGPLIEKLEIAGPGFVNITLRAPYLSAEVDTLLRNPRLGIDLPENPLKVIIDFSSPNTAKEMHVGHLRSTIIGDSLARLFEFFGHDVLRLNHIGDWGTAFGMLIAYMKEQAPHVLTGEENTDLTHLVAWYKASKHRFDSEPEFKKRAQQEVVHLQSGDPQALKGWKIICRISNQAYQEIYNLLDVELVERGESFYNPFLAEVVADLESKGLVTVSDGAKCIFLEGFQNREGEPLPLMVQKSDGGYNYDTTDMAAIRHRINVEKADRLIYVTDAGQGTHFQMIFKAAEKAGYLDPSQVKVDHVPFGLVLGIDGKKFRTRSGDTEKLIDLIYAAIDQAKKILMDRDPLRDPLEVDALSESLGIGSIKYADLSCNRTGDYVFSYDRMLRFEGNTAPYLMYAYVRVAGIKRKVGLAIDQVLKESTIELKHPSEIALGLHLLQFNEALDAMARELLPNRLTDYLYTLAEKFNAFFRDCRVEGTPEQGSRLLLAEATARVMYKGLIILGLHPVDRM